MDRLLEAQEFAAAVMAAVQQIIEEQVNRKRDPPPQLRAGDKVWLSLKNISTPQLKKKFAWLNAKYTVVKLKSRHVVELDVPSSM